MTQCRSKEVGETDTPNLDVISEQKMPFTFKIAQSNKVASLQLMFLSAMFELGSST